MLGRCFLSVLVALQSTTTDTENPTMNFSISQRGNLMGFPRPRTSAVHSLLTSTLRRTCQAARFLRLLKNIESKILLKYGSVSKPCTLVNIKIAGKWMFIPLKMVSIGIDPYPYSDKSLFYLFQGLPQQFTPTKYEQIARFSGEFDLRPVLVIKC